MKVILALLMVAASSCCTVYTLTEINCCGKIVSQKSVISPDGDMEYTARIKKREYIQYTTFNRFNLGDTLCFRAIGEPTKK